MLTFSPSSNSRVEILGGKFQFLSEKKMFLFRVDCDLGQHGCDFGTCVDGALKCDGKVDCPDDDSDERNCVGEERGGGPRW